LRLCIFARRKKKKSAAADPQFCGAGCKVGKEQRIGNYFFAAWHLCEKKKIRRGGSQELQMQETRAERRTTISLRPPRRAGLCALPTAGRPLRAKTELFKALIDCSTHLVAEVKSIRVWGAY
jgi:hypothetical protein